jgi:hypothetical protein
MQLVRMLSTLLSIFEWFASRGIFEAFASGPLGTLKVSDEMQGLLLPLLSAVRLLVVTLTPQ